MGTLTIGVFSSLIGSMNLDFAVKLAETAADKGHNVNLWLSGNATTAAKKGQKEYKDYSYLIKKISGLQKKGVQVAACEACSEARGIHAGEDIIEGITSIGMDWYVAKAAKSDRVLHIGVE
ncbi:MAG: DsrE family protein [Nitrospinae bacterium]|nr:DsrE family protein [Nitrospinota bacterium]